MPTRQHASASKFIWILKIAFALLTFSAIAKGDGSAEELFRQGRDDMKSGRYADACGKFRESHRLYPGNAALLNLALCEELLEQFAQAWTHLRACLKRFPEADPRRAIAEEHFNAVGRRVAMLTLVLSPSAARPADLRIDGRHIADAEMGVPLPLDAGSHEITLIAGGRPPQRIVLTLKEGEKAVRTIGLDARHPAPSARAPPERLRLRAVPSEHEAIPPLREARQAGSTQRMLGYALGGVGIAALAATGVMGIMISDKQAIVREHCPNKSCDREGYEAGEQGRRLVGAAIGALVVGTAALGGGVYLLVTDDSSKRSLRNGSRVAQAAPSVRWNVALRALPATDGARFELGGRF